MTFVQIRRFCSVPVSVIIHEIYQDEKRNIQRSDLQTMQIIKYSRMMKVYVMCNSSIIKNSVCILLVLALILSCNDIKVIFFNMLLNKHTS